MCLTLAQQTAATLGAFAIGIVIGAAVVILGVAAFAAAPAETGPSASRSGRPS